MDEDAKKWLYWGIPIVVVIGAGVALYFGRKHGEAKVEQAAQVQTPASSAPPASHPIEEQQADKPLPTLVDSDDAVQDSLTSLFGRALEPYLVPQNVIRHAVVTIDNLPRKKTAVQLWPIRPTAGTLTVAPGDEATLSADNAARYAPLVKMVQSADMAQLASLYKHFYPLFQEAYVDLGYPNGYFNDRLVEVIDHLLATPDVQGSIKLTQPGVFYQYADPSLEERSAGQKLLIRMGSENAAALKAKLRELRKEVTKESARKNP